MPLISGKGSDIESANVSELMHGKVVGKTRRKFGKKRARKQAVAISLAEARKSGRKAPLANKRTPRKHA